VLRNQRSPLSVKSTGHFEGFDLSLNLTAALQCMVEISERPTNYLAFQVVSTFFCRSPRVVAGVNRVDCSDSGWS
jgi:hypothetical protein